MIVCKNEKKKQQQSGSLVLKRFVRILFLCSDFFSTYAKGQHSAAKVN
jgi:hypothetical protein